MASFLRGAPPPKENPGSAPGQAENVTGSVVTQEFGERCNFGMYKLDRRICAAEIQNNSV